MTDSFDQALKDLEPQAREELRYMLAKNPALHPIILTLEKAWTYLDHGDVILVWHYHDNHDMTHAVTCIPGSYRTLHFRARVNI